MSHDPNNKDCPRISGKHSKSCQYFRHSMSGSIVTLAWCDCCETCPPAALNDMQSFVRKVNSAINGDDGFSVGGGTLSEQPDAGSAAESIAGYSELIEKLANTMFETDADEVEQICGESECEYCTEGYHEVEEWNELTQCAEVNSYPCHYCNGSGIDPHYRIDTLLRIVDQLRVENQKLHDALLPGEYNHLEINEFLRAELAAAQLRVQELEHYLHGYMTPKGSITEVLSKLAAAQSELERLTS